MLFPLDDAMPVATGGPPGCANSPFYLDQRWALQLEEDGPAWMFSSLNLIPWAIENTTVVFPGLNRPGMDDAFAYCSSPPTTLLAEYEIPQHAPVPILILYITPCNGNGSLVCGLGWRKEHQQKPGWPCQYEEFGGPPLWQKT